MQLASSPNIVLINKIITYILHFFYDMPWLSGYLSIMIISDVSIYNIQNVLIMFACLSKYPGFKSLPSCTKQILFLYFGYMIP